MTFVPKNFVDGIGPVIPADWLNELDQLANGALQSKFTVPELQQILGIPTTASPLPISEGGTGAGDAPTALSNLGGTTLAAAVAAVTPIVLSAITQGFVGLTLWPQSQAESAVGVVPTNYFYYYDDLRRYGAVLDGATDCTAAMVQACLVGGYFRLRGSMALASASLAALNAGAGLALKSSTTFQSVPGWSITITGSTACNLFRSTNGSDIQFIDCYFIGNGGPVSSGFGYLWYQMCTAGATKNTINCKFIRGGAENFGGLYWIYADNTAFTTFTYEKFLCDGSHFVSKSGNCQTAGLTTTTTTAAIFGFSGSDTNPSVYSVKDCVVRNCVANGTFIKEFLFFWSGVLRSKAHDNVLNGFGSDSSISDDTASYALTAYDHSHGTGLQPHLIEFYNNVINVVRDCGIYHASANQIDIYDNNISGQTSTANGTIPKGAIAGNGTTLLFMRDNTVVNCKIGVTAAQDPSTADIYRINNTTILQVPVNGIGMLISGTTGGNANDIGVNGLSVDTAAGNVTALRVSGTSAVGINNLDLMNIDIHGCANGILLSSVDATVVALGNVRIVNAKIRACTVNTLTWANASNAGSRLLLENIDFLDMVAGATGLQISSSLKVTIDGMRFQDLTTGATFCWYGGGAQGRVANVQFVNVPSARRYDASANRMGVDVPTWTGNDNDYVLSLNQTELGSAASKYTRDGWIWDVTAAVWLERRLLTGN